MQFAVRLDIVPVPGEFFTNVTCITVAYPEKHMHVVPHNLNTFANVVLEVTVCKCSTKKVFLKIVQNLQEKTYAGVSFLKKMQASSVQLKGLYPTNFFKKIIFSFFVFDVFWYFKLWRIHYVIYFCWLELFMLLFSITNWQSRRMFRSNGHSNEFYLF